MVICPGAAFPPMLQVGKNRGRAGQPRLNCMEREQTNTEQKGPRGTERKSYASPRLVDYGPVSKLTQGTSTRGSDSTPGALLKRHS